jgi:hypothetical protein
MLQTAEDIRLLNEKITHAAGFVTRINDELGRVLWASIPWWNAC